MIAGIAATKADLTEWVYEQGLTALHLLLREDAEKIAGPKGKHEKERTHNHWGSTDGELSFGGRRIQVSRPRVRSKSGEEASLPHFEAFREEDPLPERVLNQILVGVSTRNYESSLDKPAAKLKSRGTSKSAASRHLVRQTTKKLEEYLSRRLEEFELAALMMDGLEVAGQTVVVTLGITIDGTKVPLGIWLGSTENSRVCTAMLQNLLERGLRIDESILCVVDGGKGVHRLPSSISRSLAERRPGSIGHITLRGKCAGARSEGKPHAACDVAGAGNGLTVRLVRHSHRKRGETDRPRLRSTAPTLDPTGSLDRKKITQAFRRLGSQRSTTVARSRLSR